MIGLILLATLFVGVQTADAAQVTRCSTANTVCATAIAEPVVSCGSNYGMRHCTVGGAVGGHGTSATKLSGTVSWWGSVCGGEGGFDCATTKYVGGDCAWGASTNGCGYLSPVTIDTYTCFLCAVSAYARATSTANAKSTLGSVMVETVTVSASASAYQTMP